MVESITTRELQELLGSGEKPLLIDVRDTGDFENWHINGSRNLPAFRILAAGRVNEFLDRLGGLPEDRPIVAVCYTGYTSGIAAEALRRRGFDAVNLEGGINEWSLAWNSAQIDTDIDGGRMIQLRRIGKGCLSYLLIADDRAVLVDPSLSTETYREIMEAEDVRLDYILETHVHADHISRGRALASEFDVDYRAPINDRVTFEYTPVHDGDVLEFGPFSLRALHTPGHTGEHMCYLVNDQVLLTGDALFVDSVGRPDLERGDRGAKPGAEALYTSLHDRILILDRDIRVAPAHHGAPIGFDDTPITATLAEVGALPVFTLDHESFVARILDSLGSKPNNFEQVIAINEGRRSYPLANSDILELEAGPNRCAAG